MSETRVRPRFELEGRIERLEPEALPVPLAPPPPERGSLGLAVAGAAVLGLGLIGLDIGNFVADQFARGAALGWATLGVAGGGFGLIAAAGWREWRGLRRLHRVDRLRAALADPDTIRDAALEWLRVLPEGQDIAQAVRVTNDPDAIRALLRAGPLATLRARSEALGRQAALHLFAATAALPSPALDGLLVFWRGARLVRQVAALHGLRPGTAATLALLRRVLLGAAGVAAADLAATTLAGAVLSNPLLEHLAGDLAGATLAARRMIVLARVTAAACSPLEPE